MTFGWNDAWQIALFLLIMNWWWQWIFVWLIEKAFEWLDERE